MGFDFGDRYRRVETSGETPFHQSRFGHPFDVADIDCTEAAFLRLLNRLAICGLDAAAPPLLAGR